MRAIVACAVLVSGSACGVEVADTTAKRGAPPSPTTGNGEQVAFAANPAINGWGCEFSQPACTANMEGPCKDTQGCEWVAGACREKSCIASWRRLCQDFLARRAAGDRFAYRGNNAPSSDLFTTGPEPVRPEWRWGDVGGTLSYTWEGHSSVTSANAFLNFALQVVRDRVPTATTYNLTNNGCGTFNPTNFQTITNFLKQTLHPILRARDPKAKVVLCGQQNVCAENDSTAYRPCGDGQCAGARGNGFSRICFKIDGNNAQPEVSYNAFNDCGIGRACTEWAGHNLSWCRSNGQWACQQCTQEGNQWRFRAPAGFADPVAGVGACNMVAGL